MLRNSYIFLKHRPFQLTDISIIFYNQLYYTTNLIKNHGIRIVCEFNRKCIYFVRIHLLCIIINNDFCINFSINTGDVRKIQVLKEFE